MKRYELIAPCHFGLEAVLKQEITDLGYDVSQVEDNMLEELDTRDACVKVRQCVQTCLTPRERMIITMRYGLDDRTPRTQREIAGQCGISRSYVSRIEKKALEKLQAGMEGWSP